MSQNHNFRSAIGGFNRQDVVRYIEYLNNKHTDQVNPARFLGAVVVCQGADDPQVRLQVIDAVSKATGLRSNCIAVLKMK